jgi:protein O-GlcNAc transferase
LNFKFIRHKTTKEVCDLIYNDHIHILFDLSGHTAFNRMDVFYVKPAPIQISYIGYPYTTGVNKMDYRITDNICDSEQSQKYYSEKLLFLKNCFLCYDPYKKDNELPKVTDLQPYLNNGYLTFGCFNRLNKINDSVIELFNKIMLRYPKCRFVFKTKAIINHNISHKFLNKFDESVRDRITLLDCTILHDQHLLEYNKIDISIDTFPYSGTTTSCESLMMGVPVLSYYDNVNYYHPQNVTASILKNSNLDEYVYTNTIDDGNSDSIFKKIDNLLSDISIWKNFKMNVRNSFINGKVCNSKEYMNNFEELLLQLTRTIH